MFRRIELIESYKLKRPRAHSRCFGGRVSGDSVYWKNGLCGLGTSLEVILSWADMPCPNKAVNKNCRFYFTEKGWEEYGRRTVATCRRVGQQFRVITIKECSVDVFYRDEVQVAIRPKRRRK